MRSLRFVPFAAALALAGCFSSTSEPGIDPAASYQLTLTDAAFASDHVPFTGIEAPAATGEELRVDFLVEGERIDARVCAPWDSPVRYAGTVGDGVIAFAPVDQPARLDGTVSGWMATIDLRSFEIDGELVDGALVWDGTGRFEAGESYFAGDVGDFAESAGALEARIDDVAPEARVSDARGGFGGPLLPWEAFSVRFSEPVEASSIEGLVRVEGGAATVEIADATDDLVTAVTVRPEGWWEPVDRVAVALAAGAADLEGNVAAEASRRSERVRRPAPVAALDFEGGDWEAWGAAERPADLECAAGSCEAFYLEGSSGGLFARVHADAPFTTVRARVRVVSLADEWGGGWAQPVEIELGASPEGAPSVARASASVGGTREEPDPDSMYLADSGWVDVELPLDEALTEAGVVLEARAFGYGGAGGPGGGAPLPPTRAYVLVDDVVVE